MTLDASFDIFESDPKGRDEPLTLTCSCSAENSLISELGSSVCLWIPRSALGVRNGVDDGFRILAGSLILKNRMRAL